MLLYVVFSVAARAQVSDNQLFFSLGVSSPMGALAQKSLTTPGAGISSGGMALNMGYIRRFNDHMGLELRVVSTNNYIDTSLILDQLKIQSKEVWTAQSDEISGWRSNGILAGPTWFLKASETFLVDFRILGGYLLMQSPACTFRSKRDPETWMRLEESSKGGLGYGLGAGAALFVNGKYGLHVNLEYLGGVFRFDEIKKTYSNGIILSQGSMVQFLHALNINLGASYNF
jgi:hypothetical protein